MALLCHYPEQRARRSERGGGTPGGFIALRVARRMRARGCASRREPTSNIDVRRLCVPGSVFFETHHPVEISVQMPSRCLWRLRQRAIGRSGRSGPDLLASGTRKRRAGVSLTREREGSETAESERRKIKQKRRCRPYCRASANYLALPAALLSLEFSV